MTKKILRRYTQLPALFYMLSERKLTLLDPNSWDDKNDSYFLEQYKAKRKLETVLALCFSMAQETYHHWSVFADGSAGVCIQFKRDELIDAIKGDSAVRYGEVKYLTLDKIESRKLKIKELPFTKRYPYLHESEWRIIFNSAKRRKQFHAIPIPVSSIRRISLSPWLPDVFKEHVKNTIWSIKDCGKLEIVRSTLIGNERWKKAGEEAV